MSKKDSSEKWKKEGSRHIGMRYGDKSGRSSKCPCHNVLWKEHDRIINAEKSER